MRMQKLLWRDGDKMKTKSEILKNYAQAEAKKTGRIFVDWNYLSQNQKSKIKENPKCFIVFFDIKFGNKLICSGIPRLKNV
jgi:hypothetical protein